MDATCPNMELMLITDPEPCRRIGSDASWLSAKTDSRLTRRTSWKLCSSACRSGPPDDDAGVVDADVDSAEAVERGPDELAAVGLDRHVAADRVDRGIRGGERLSRLEPARAGDDLGAGRCEHRREPGAEAARRARQDRDAPVERAGIASQRPQP